MDHQTQNAAKALFLDLDGTLLDDKKQVSPRDREAIERMLQQGHHVIIATGRPLSSALVQAEKLGLTGEGCLLIAYNGGILYDTARQQVIHEIRLPLSLVRAVFDEAARRGLHIQTYEGAYVVAEPAGSEACLRYYEHNSGMPWKIVPDVTALSEEPVKMLMIDREGPERLEAMRGWIAEHFGDRLDTFFSSADYVEIVSHGLNKGQAVRQMAGLLGISIEDTIAAGDAENDITMIRAAGVGCAMRNASEAVKAAADYVTEADNNHSGVAEIIRRFILQDF